MFSDILELLATLGTIAAFAGAALLIVAAYFTLCGLGWLIGRGRDAWIARAFPRQLEQEIAWRMAQGYGRDVARQRALRYLRKKENRQ